MDQANTSLSAVMALAKNIDGVDSVSDSFGTVELRVTRPKLLAVMQTLKSSPDFSCKLILDITIVDWVDARTERFEAVYHVYSVNLAQRFKVKVVIPENDPKIDSIVPVWAGANFLEREAWDMYGVVFTGHPDLRRILMYDEFKGYPLRKDYPVQGKQPRIPMRSPEVRNTALDLKRGELVQISNRKSV